MTNISSLVKRPLLALATIMAVGACGGAGGTPSASTADVGSGSLTGAGATFPEPFYTKAFFQYSARYPGVTVNYQAVGSGAGIQQFTKGTVDFGASDVPMTDAEVSAAGGQDALVELPTTLGVVAVAYNLSGVQKLKLDGPALANIFLGHIKKWNDPALVALNSGVSLPNKEISVVHRSDGSGTTFAFTDYLGKVSDEWKTKVGTAKSVQWPVGIGASGNVAVANGVKQADGGIGYVELAYVVQTGMQSVMLKNANGKFVAASVDGATAAAGTNKNVSPTSFSITNAVCDTCYPIASFSWVILKKSQADPTKGKAVVYLLRWLVTDGQQYGKDLQYAPLPTAVEQLAETTLKSVTVNGKAVLT